MAMVGGFVYALVGLRVSRLVEYLYYVGNIGNGFVAVSLPIGAMAAIVALHVLQRELYGWAGALLSLMAFVGLAFAAGALTVGVLSSAPALDPLFMVLIVGSLVATAGLALLGGMAVATGVLPRLCGVALIAGSPFGVFLTMIPSAARGEASPIGGAFQALGGVPWILVGLAIFRSAGRRTG